MKKTINWTEIQARYLNGESPTAMAKEYKGCTPNKIWGKAHRDGWTKGKQRIAKAVEEETKSAATQLCSVAEKIHLRVLEELIDGQGQLTAKGQEVFTPFLTEEQRVNPLLQAALNNATRVMLHQYKHAPQEASSSGPITLRIIKQGFKE